MSLRRAAALLGGLLGGLATLAVAPRAAIADHEEWPRSALLGPVIGVSWGQGNKAHPTLGLEGGIGLHELAYLNAGITGGDDEVFSYVELDGWYAVGATVGVGHGTERGVQPVLGVWEALPMILEETCDTATVIAFSAGYRWTGKHELYVAAKYGDTWNFCFD